MEDEAPTAVIWVRATANLSGLRCGGVALVDPSDGEIAELLEHRWLVPLTPEEQLDVVSGVEDAPPTTA